jgi:hypothetical protein
VNPAVDGSWNAGSPDDGSWNDGSWNEGSWNAGRVGVVAALAVPTGAPIASAPRIPATAAADRFFLRIVIAPLLSLRAPRTSVRDAFCRRVDAASYAR